MRKAALHSPGQMGLNIHYRLAIPPNSAGARYWNNRDEKVLTKEVGRWNAIIPSFAGGLKDELGGERSESQITKYPNFEHLEAEGRGPEERAEPGDGS